MKKEITDLWENYLVEAILKKCDEEVEARKQWAKNEDALRSKLNQEQIALLEEYDQSFFAVNSFMERRAFAKGVKFAVRFLFEALCED